LRLAAELLDTFCDQAGIKFIVAIHSFSVRSVRPEQALSGRLPE
jgi:hypothetical protein